MSELKIVYVFEGDDLSKFYNKLKKNYKILYLCPSAYYKNAKLKNLNFEFYGNDFNDYVKTNFKSFSFQYYNSICNLNKLSLDNFSKESIKNLILPILSVYYYATYKISKNRSYYLKNNNLILIKSSEKKNFLKKFLFENNQLIFVRQKNLFQYFPRFIYLVNRIIFAIIKNKSTCLIQDQNYGFKKIPLQKNEYLYLNFLYVNKFNIFDSLLSFFKFLFLKKNIIKISIPIIDYEPKNKYDFNFFSGVDKDLSEITNDTFANMIQYLSILDKNYKSYIYKYVKTKFSIFHNLKWMDDLIFSQTFSKNFTYLASHSSHPPTSDVTSKFFLSDLSSGLLYSSFANKFLIQSEFSFKSYLSYKYPKNNIIRVKPFVWGGNDVFKLNKYNKNRKKVKLLHASTFKIKSFRPYIYENSNLYFHKLQKICYFVSQLPNFYLTIRPCINKEFKISDYKKMLDLFKCDRINISLNKPFIQDLKISDITLSFSSTTIEESIYFGKKVFLLSSKNEHKHFSNNNMISSIDIENLSFSSFEKKTISFLNRPSTYQKDNSLSYKKILK